MRSALVTERGRRGRRLGKLPYQPGQVANGNTGDQEGRVAAEAVVRIPPKAAVGRRLGIVLVERLGAVESADARAHGLGSKRADGDQGGDSCHYSRVRGEGAAYTKESVWNDCFG